MISCVTHKWDKETYISIGGVYCRQYKLHDECRFAIIRNKRKRKKMKLIRSLNDITLHHATPHSVYSLLTLFTGVFYIHISHGRIFAFMQVSLVRQIGTHK